MLNRGLDRIRRALVWRWTRLTMPFKYEREDVSYCWCGGRVCTSPNDPRIGCCLLCGTGILRRRLTEASYQKWYASGDYRKYTRGSDEVTLSQFLREFRRGVGAIHFLEVAGYPIQGKSLLDFGCGAGGALVAASILTTRPVIGADTDTRSIMVTQQFGIPVFPGVAVGIRLDRIILSHVIEHVLDPVGLLKMLAGHLTQDGVIYIETPAWKATSEIKLAHVFYLVPASFRLLVERAGLEILAMTDGIQGVVRRAA